MRKGTFAKWVAVSPILSAVLLAACAGPMTVPLSDSARNELKSRAGIRAVHYAPPRLTITTAGKVLLDDVTLGTVPDGDYAKLYHVPDPAPTVETALVQALEGQAGFRKLTVVDQPLARSAQGFTSGPLDSIDSIKAAYGTGVVLDVGTIYWGGMYFTTNWTRYRLGVGIQARLVRLDDAQVLWKGTCWYSTDTDGKIEPSMTELRANDGALLKKIAADTGQTCSQRLVSQLLNGDATRVN